MATVTHAIATPSSTDLASYTTGSFTPAFNDLLIIFIVTSGTTVDNPTCTASTGMTFTKIATVSKNVNADRLHAFVSNSKTTAVSQTITFNNAGVTANGCLIEVIRIADMPLTGISAIRQFITVANQLSATQPISTFSSAVLTGNPTIGFVGNATNPATLTPPTNWAEPAGSDTGYATPVTGAQYAYRNSGYTGTTLTWVGTSSSAFGIISLELAAQAVTVTWLEVEPPIRGISSKSFSVTGTSVGTHQRLLISWLEVEVGAPSNGTSSKNIGFTGSAVGSIARYIKITWLEVEYYDTSTGISSNSIGFTGSSSGTHQKLFISWLELEPVFNENDANSTETIANITGSATGSSPLLTSYGSSNKSINVTGSAVGTTLKITISWLKLETSDTIYGNGWRTFNVTGLATGEHVAIEGTSTKSINLSGSSYGEMTYSVITWLKIEQTPTNVGISTNNIANITGFGTAITSPLIRGTSNKTIASISRSSIGKLTVKGTSNKTITFYRTDTVFEPSLRVYYSPARNHVFVSPVRTNEFVSGERTNEFVSPERTTEFSPESRTHVYQTPNRIGI